MGVVRRPFNRVRGDGFGRLPHPSCGCRTNSAPNSDRDMRAEVTIKIVSGDLPDDMKRYFVDEVVKSLAQRTVAIEPASEPKSVVIELT